MVDAAKPRVGRPRKDAPVRSEIGHAGLAVNNGNIREGRDILFMGREWRRTIGRMLDTDPLLGGIFLAIDLKIAKAKRNLKAADDSEEAKRQRAFFLGAMNDMSAPFQALMPQITTMIPQGWSYFEVVNKLRMGKTPKEQVLTDGNRRQPAASKYDDGLIGWHKWAHRHPDTLLKWDFAPGGTLRGMVQRDPASGDHLTIPIQRSLLFRPRYVKGNPEGKALDPATPLPTPDGWRTIGDLREGDRVFDERGMIRHVTATATWNDRPVYEVVFSTGEAIVADADHEWLTYDANARYRHGPPGLRTTAEIAGSLHHGTQRSTNHAVPLAGSWRYVRRHLPIDPYAVGYWLGDGNTRSGAITTGDTEVADYFRELGYPTERIASSDYGYRVQGGFQRQLRVAGLLGNKHVPDAYLQGDRDQRLALLQGLMDSDGSVDQWGRCEFSNTNPLLSAAVAELARSLGCKASVSRKQRSDEGYKDAILVKFTPDFPAFRLPRKLARQKFDRDFKWRRNYHHITDARPIDNRTTVCIEVDGPSHLFLVGWNGIPTHNSVLTNAYRPWYFGRNIEQVEAQGLERDMTGTLLMYLTENLLDPSASDEEKAALQGYIDLVEDIRIDPTTAAILPSLFDSSGNRLVSLELLKSAGTRQYNTDSIINRYAQKMAFATLAQFMLLGTDKTGSFALSSNQSDLFLDALNTWCDAIADVINGYGIRRLCELNDWDPAFAPTFSFSRITNASLQEVSEYLQRITNAGALLFPNADLAVELLQLAGLSSDGLPDPDDEAAKALERRKKFGDSLDNTVDDSTDPKKDTIGPGKQADPKKREGA